MSPVGRLPSASTDGRLAAASMLSEGERRRAVGLILYKTSVSSQGRLLKEFRQNFVGSSLSSSM